MTGMQEITLVGQEYSYSAKSNFIYIYNMSDTPIYVSQYHGISVDNSIIIPAGKIKSCYTIGTLYITGSGKIRISTSYNDLKLVEPNDADTLNGKSEDQFVSNQSSDFNFSMIFGDHAYITNKIDKNIPNIPVVSNYTHIITRDSTNHIVSILSIGVDYTKNIYIYQSHTGEWIDLRDNATRLISPTGKVLLFEDNEGGNLRLVSPDDNKIMEMDLYSNSYFRMYFADTEAGYVDDAPFVYNFDTRKIHIRGDIEGNADTVGGLHATEISVNSNIIHNPDFKINQRGQTEYTEAYYSYDRWRLGRNKGIVTASNCKCTIYCDDITDPQHIFQNIEGDYSGKTLTFSLNVDTVSKCGCNFVIADASWNILGGANIASSGKLVCTVKIPENTPIIKLLIGVYNPTEAGAYIVISKPKLEIGSIATQYAPPDPAIELVKCQRYYEIILDNHIDRSIIGLIYQSTRTCEFDIPFKVTKRIPPTLVYDKARIVIFDSKTGALITAHTSDIRVVAVDTNGMLIKATLPESIALTDTCTVTLDNLSIGTPIAVSSE